MVSLKNNCKQNSACDELCCLSCLHEHVTPLVDFALVASRTQKTATVCYSVISCTAHYLPDLLELYTTSYTLHTCADDKLFHIPNRCKKFSRRAHHSPPPPPPPPLVLSPPPSTQSGTISLSQCDMLKLSSFKLQLKTHLFSVSFSKQMCVWVHACVYIGKWGGGGGVLMTNLSMLILSVSVQLCTIRCVSVCWKWWERWWM